MRRIKTAILISGRGTNMNALIEASQSRHYPAQIDLVISNRPEALGLITAQKHGVTALALDHTDFKSRRAFEKALNTVLREANIELICCAGFMRVLTPWFVTQWEGHMINIHPSLLPKYKGLHTHKRALEAGDSEHGCSVHWVTSELDSGGVILQDTIKIKPDDTEDSLATRLLEKELSLYPQALKLVAQDLLNQDQERDYSFTA